jgi:nucleoside-diphosphate-sugar epimerase
MPEKVIDVGVKSLFSAISACKKNKIKNLIIASSSEVYQLPKIIPTPEEIEVKIPDITNPRYSYGASKIISEIIGMHYGKNFFKKVIIFRPHNVYGPDMGNEHVIPQIISKISKSINLYKKSIRIPIKINGNGQQTRSFIYIDDFIDGLLLVIKKGVNRNIYHIGKNEEIKIINLIKKIFKIFGKKPIINFGKNVLGETSRRCPDISKISKLGFKSKFTLSMGLKNTVDWYRDNI